ncbi:MAG: D-2-hydroxyacid dehydrogenase [Thermoguttaceae bacterium]
MSPQRLVVCFKESPIDAGLVGRMAEAWPDVEIVNVGQRELPDALLETDFFCGHAKVPVDWDAIVSRGRLQWIQSSAAGMDWCLVPSVIASPMTITTASGVLADQVAEHTLALVLSWMRNLPTFFHEQCNPSADGFRKFIRRPTRDLTDSTVGILGFGGVGRRLAEVLSAFHCRILACDLFPQDAPSYVEQIYSADEYRTVLSQSDVVVLCLPLNSSTRSLIGADALRTMKSSSLLVNVARGAIVETDALVAALESGSIAGAVVDVTNPEPLPPTHRLWDFPNVIITPHVGGQSYRRFDGVVDLFCENVRLYKSGEPLINLLSPEGKRLGFPLRSETPLWSDRTCKSFQ